MHGNEPKAPKPITNSNSAPAPVTTGVANQTNNYPNGAPATAAIESKTDAKDASNSAESLV